MAAAARGSEVLFRLKKTLLVEAAVAGAYNAFHAYSEDFQAGEGNVPDNELGGSDRNNAVDPSQPAEALPSPTGRLVVPTDLMQCGWWFALLFGWPVTTGSTPNYTHTFTSGQAAPGMAHFEMPTTTGLFRFGDSQCVNQISLNMEKQDGTRQMELGLTGRSVRYAGAAISSSVVASPTRAKVPGYIGKLKLNDVDLGNVLGGQVVLANGASYDRYVDDQKYPSAVEMGEPSAVISPRFRVKQDVASQLPTFDNVTPFKVEWLMQINANLNLSLVFPNVIAPLVIPSTNGTGLYEYAPQMTASQKKGGSSAPMCTVTLKNQFAAYT